MATVYLCTDKKFGRPVAIKLLHPDLAAAVGADRFHREIKIATGLTHPNILPANDSGEAEGSLYYVMPFVEGESLRDRIGREKQLPVDDTVRIITEVANALQYAHTHGIVHRDIKPENILLESGVAVVADFGIARAITSASDVEALTQTGVSIGTPTYMSPEQAVGEKGVDGRSDQYSLACVMYEMLAGQPPFVAASLQGIIMKHVSEPPPLITTVRPSVPDELEDVILRALEKVPADRFASIGDFAAALSAVVMQTGTWTRRTSTRTAQLRTTTRRNLVAIPEPMPLRRKALIAAAILAVTVGGAAGAWQFRTPETIDPNASRIAVLYFEDESRTGDLRDLADGLTESLIERLNEVSVLTVVSRHGVLPFRGTALRPDSVGRALSVGSVVRGSVEPTARGATVTVRLIDAGSGADIDRERFDYDSTQINVVAIADSVANQVALFLQERVGREVRLQERRRATKNTDAWMFVQRAERRSKDADSLVIAGAILPAIAALDEADSMLVLAESSDRAWSTPVVLRASVAWTKARAMRAQPTAVPAVIDRGLAHADRALEMEPRNADALEFKGKLLYMQVAQQVVTDARASDRVLAEAESTLTRAVTINKLQAGAWDELSALHYRKPDLQQAILAAQNAYNADVYLRSARPILDRLFRASYNLEQFPEANKWLLTIQERFPNDPLVVENRLLMYRTKFEKPDVDSAWKLAGEYVRRSPQARQEFARSKAEILISGVLANAATALASPGLADSARAVLTRARRIDRALDPRRELPAQEASVRVMLGDYDDAVALLQDYLTVNPSHRRGFQNRTGWWWRDLQSNSKFKALIAGL